MVKSTQIWGVITNPEINISGMITTFSSITSKKQGVFLFFARPWGG
jgi:hypothetical protein